jgi:hypothetical protein
MYRLWTKQLLWFVGKEFIDWLAGMQDSVAFQVRELDFCALS